ncbi:MAG TPA: hypothetical protein VGQ39_15380 [Pyrinomonadaceae bacterium]|nr:hypothetical protein [Pyrinomonadaceae bacterium]
MPTSPATQSSPQKTVMADSPGVKPKIDACAMLTSKDIESIQGEPVKETKLSGTSVSGFNISQCFFTLPTFMKSISLSVTQRGDGLDARDPREFWKDTFHREKDLNKGREREKQREGEEEEKSAPPKKITGIGEEAFWTASRVAGALYVLKGHSYVRVSVGGPGDEKSKIRKSKTLAQKVIDRL